MSKKQSPSPASKPMLIHQIDPHRRQHRIIIITAGKPDNGPWFDTTSIAMHKGLLASTVQQGGLPEGIFIVTRKAYEVLS